MKKKKTKVINPFLGTIEKSTIKTKTAQRHELFLQYPKQSYSIIPHSKWKTGKGPRRSSSKQNKKKKNQEFEL